MFLPGTEDRKEDLEMRGHSDRNHGQLPVWQVGACPRLAGPGGEGSWGGWAVWTAGPLMAAGPGHRAGKETTGVLCGVPWAPADVPRSPGQEVERHSLATHARQRVSS